MSFANECERGLIHVNDKVCVHHHNWADAENARLGGEQHGHTGSKTMVTKAHSAAGERSTTFSPLIRCDSLLSLAEDANHAGLLMTANRLLDLATSVLGEPPQTLAGQ